MSTYTPRGPVGEECVLCHLRLPSRAAREVWPHPYTPNARQAAHTRCADLARGVLGPRAEPDIHHTDRTEAPLVLWWHRQAAPATALDALAACKGWTEADRLAARAWYRRRGLLRDDADDLVAIASLMVAAPGFRWRRDLRTVEPEPGEVLPDLRDRSTLHALAGMAAAHAGYYVPMQDPETGGWYEPTDILAVMQAAAAPEPRRAGPLCPGCGQPMLHGTGIDEPSWHWVECPDCGIDTGREGAPYTTTAEVLDALGYTYAARRLKEKR